MKHGVVRPEEYEAFRHFLADACGIVLGENKHYLVVSRLTRVMAENSVDTLGNLVDRLKGGRANGLKEKIIEAMTTNETFWFRDNYPFEILNSTLFPQFADERVRPVRVWSAASSSGQEAYSISMTAQEFLQKRPGGLPQIEIVGTDISPAIIKEAQEARYDRLAVTRGLSQERKDKFFTNDGFRWQVRPDIVSRVRFRQANLLQSYALLGRFHVIFCRNVLIYFSSESKRDIIARMAQALHPGGYLFLGASEAINQHTDRFEQVRVKTGVVYRLKS